MEPKQSWQANRGGLEPRDERRREVVRKTRPTCRAEALTNGHANQWREGVWLPERDITRNRNSLGDTVRIGHCKFT